jgi:hypothetical protein
VSTTATTPTRPARWVLVAATVLAALYAALPIMLVLDLDAVRATVRARSPALDAHGVDAGVRAVVAYSAILHAVSVAVLLWFTVQTLKGRRWARIALTAFLVARRSRASPRGAPACSSSGPSSPPTRCRSS